MASNFRTLELAKVFVRVCHRVKAKKVIKDQLDRASLSVALNLAEGSARNGVADRNRFYRIALGSYREWDTILEIIPVHDPEILELMRKLGAHLNNLCKSTQR